MKLLRELKKNPTFKSERFRKGVRVFVQYCFSKMLRVVYLISESRALVLFRAALAALALAISENSTKAKPEGARSYLFASEHSNEKLNYKV